MASIRAGNLPSDFSSFVGRGAEIREVRQLLGQARLVSVIGPGGVGKSRFAVQVATQIQKTFRDGVWLVELASVSNPRLVPEAVASVLLVPEQSDREPTEALCQYLAQRELLLVLDNCEQLRDACAVVLSTVLLRAPGLRVLATSQEVFGLAGEAVYQLDPLSVSNPEEGLAAAQLSPAVVLFADRAASAMHGFAVTKDNLQAVVELCRRTDGLPLAIELAAAHARTLTPAQMLERMDDRFGLLAAKSTAIPSRHQSLKATVSWSYDLCGKPERLVWNRLSVFPSSFDLPSAVAVCGGDGLSPAEVADAVGELVDRSVLISEPQPWGMRYRLLESIRDYAVEMLRETADTEHAVASGVLRSRHFDRYVKLASDFDQDWFGPRQHEWLERLRLDLPNIRAALSFAVDHPAHGETGLKLAADLHFFWRVVALREGEAWLGRLLEAENEPSPGRGRALVTLARLFAARGESAAIAVAAEALDTARRFDPGLVPQALAVRGALMTDEDPVNARDVLTNALVEVERIGSAADRTFVLHRLGWNFGLAGDLEGAEHYFRESLTMSQGAGELWYRGVGQLRHAQLAWMHGNKDLMASAAAAALRASRLIPDPLTSANALVIIAATVVGRDDRLAAGLFGVAEHVWNDAGGSMLLTSPWRELLEDAKTRCQTKIGRAAFDDHYRRRHEQSIDVAIALALDERPQPRPEEPAAGDFGLTRRELEVVELISQGLTNREIAARLVISQRTAESHVQHILIKTGFATRTQLTAWYTARR